MVFLSPSFTLKRYSVHGSNANRVGAARKLSSFLWATIYKQSLISLDLFVMVRCPGPPPKKKRLFNLGLFRFRFDSVVIRFSCWSVRFDSVSI